MSNHDYVGLVQLSTDLPFNNTFIQEIGDGSYLRVNEESQLLEGLNLFTLAIYPNITASNNRVGYMLVTDMDGNIVKGFYSPVQIGSPKMVNSTTALYSLRGEDGIHLWNYITNETDVFDVPSGHHEIEYNPKTNTFLIIEAVEFQEFEFEGDTLPVVGDDIVEYDSDGTELWRWDGNLTFPFNATEFYFRNETRRGEIDWMHSNSVYWDIDDNSIYMKVRHLDCVVKVDYTTSETEWVVGRYTGEDPGLDLYNIYGQPTESIFYHAHACEVIDPDTFIIYDNDLWNLARDNPLIGITRYVEYFVDEDAGTASETWVWTSPESYYTRAQGDSNRLPNGNTVGAMNQAPEPFMVEVNGDSEIVWEYVFNITDNDVAWRLSPNGLQRILLEPLVELDSSTVYTAEGTNGTVSFTSWDVIHRRCASDVAFRILEGSTVLLEVEDEYLANWQASEFSMSLPILGAGQHNLILEVENDDGLTSQTAFLLDVSSNLPLYLGLGAGAIIAVVVILYIWKKK